MIISREHCPPPHPWISLFLMVIWLVLGLVVTYHILRDLISSVYILFMLYQLISMWTCVVLYFHLKEMKRLNMSGDVTSQMIILFTETFLLISNIIFIAFFLSADMIFFIGTKEQSTIHTYYITIFLSGQGLNHLYWVGWFLSKYWRFIL
jgi:hypothetical protein